jgi:hypothetical protein
LVTLRISQHRRVLGTPHPPTDHGDDGENSDNNEPWLAQSDDDEKEQETESTPQPPQLPQPDILKQETDKKQQQPPSQIMIQPFVELAIVSVDFSPDQPDENDTRATAELSFGSPLSAPSDPPAPPSSSSSTSLSALDQARVVVTCNSSTEPALVPPLTLVPRPLVEMLRHDSRDAIIPTRSSAPQRTSLDVGLSVPVLHVTVLGMWNNPHSSPSPRLVQALAAPASQHSVTSGSPVVLTLGVDGLMVDCSMSWRGQNRFSSLADVDNDDDDGVLEVSRAGIEVQCVKVNVFPQNDPTTVSVCVGDGNDGTPNNNNAETEITTPIVPSNNLGPRGVRLMWSLSRMEQQVTQGAAFVSRGTTELQLSRVEIRWPSYSAASSSLDRLRVILRELFGLSEHLATLQALATLTSLAESESPHLLKQKRPSAWKDRLGSLCPMLWAVHTNPFELCICTAQDRSPVPVPIFSLAAITPPRFVVPVPQFDFEFVLSAFSHSQRIDSESDDAWLWNNALVVKPTTRARPLIKLLWLLLAQPLPLAGAMVQNWLKNALVCLLEQSNRRNPRPPHS